MNDFEDRLRRTPLRTPPRDLRDMVFASSPERRAWRDEIWPSPSAWAALAAVWLVLLAVESLTGSPVSVRNAPGGAIEPPSSDSVLALHAALKSANTSARPN